MQMVDVVDVDEVVKFATQVLLRVAKQYTLEAETILRDFKEELEKGAINVDDFVSHLEDLEKRFHLDLQLVSERLKTAFTKINEWKMKKMIEKVIKKSDVEDVDILYFLADLPPLLSRLGCRFNRPEAVLLGEALSYMYGGFLKYAVCALLSSTAETAGRRDVAGEIWLKCIGDDIDLRKRVICAISQFLDENNRDLLYYDLSRDIEEMRRERRGEK